MDSELQGMLVELGRKMRREGKNCDPATLGVTIVDEIEAIGYLLPIESVDMLVGVAARLFLLAQREG